MKQKLNTKISEVGLTLKAKGVELSEKDKENRKRFVLHHK